MEPYAPPALPKFTCTLQSALHSAMDDGCSFATARDGVVLRITNSSGIGSAQLALTEGEAPRRLMIQFPKMGNLESFIVSDGKVDLHGSLGCDRAFNKKGEEANDPRNAAYSLKIRKGKEMDLIEVELTLPCSEPGTKQWQLHWIDAYRR